MLPKMLYEYQWKTETLEHSIHMPLWFDEPECLSSDLGSSSPKCDTSHFAAKCEELSLLNVIVSKAEQSLKGVTSCKIGIGPSLLTYSS